MCVTNRRSLGALRGFYAQKLVQAATLADPFGALDTGAAAAILGHAQRERSRKKGCFSNEGATPSQPSRTASGDVKTTLLTEASDASSRGNSWNTTTEDPRAGVRYMVVCSSASTLWQHIARQLSAPRCGA